MKAKAIGYVRVSTEDQAREGVSLENQKAKIRAYAELKDLELVGILEDAGISAKNLNRPGIQEILKLSKSKQIEAVVVYKLDRMFRSTVDALETTKQFDRWGIAFHSIQESLDTQSAMGRFFFTLTAALAEMERGIVSERTKAALLHKKSRNQVYGEIPFGLQRSGDNLLPDEAERRVIELVLKLRGKGWNYSKIARNLNELGYRTKKGNGWFPQTVKNVVLHSEAA
jgi:DNA invertase Pin-like site-specific DNA recombinase